MALNLVLLAVLLAVIWQISARWQTAEAVQRKTVNVPIKPVPPPKIAPAPKPEAALAMKYAEVADKNLFSKDRNATIVIDPPKVEAPKPMPPLPVVYGVMGLPSGVKAVMSEKTGAPSTTIRVGESIGEFKVIALDTQNVTFEWNGKQVARRIDDLIDRSNTQTASNNQPAAAAPGPAAPAAPPPPPRPVNANPTSADMGMELTPTTKAVKPGDASPPGSIVDGYKKVCTPFPFGQLCQWVKQ